MFGAYRSCSEEECVPHAPDPTQGNGHPASDNVADEPVALNAMHRVRFTSRVFDPRNHVLRSVLEEGTDSPGRAVVFVDDGVADAWPDLGEMIAEYAAAHADVLKLQGPLHLVSGGEQCKNDWDVFHEVSRVINDAKICRHSYVIVVGGGAVLDAVGFGAATAHRGVRLVRLPTTTLAQDDAGIGVKNGINGFGKKNFIGTFSVPWAVINDEQFLTTLSDRDWRAGLSEAVKVALLKDARLFERIVDSAPRLRARDLAAARPIIQRSAILHLHHITRGGDPFELLNARPLDHGHWAAHKLEQMTDFRIRHGEAVAIGIALDALYTASLGRLDDEDAAEVLSCLTEIGFTLYDDALSDHDTILEGLEEFREHLGGRLTITLLDGIGHPFEAHEIDTGLMIESIERLAEFAAEPLHD
jgi:3-dehydroquinate synthase